MFYIFISIELCGDYQGFFLYVLFVKASIFHSMCVLIYENKNKMSFQVLNVFFSVEPELNVKFRNKKKYKN